MAKTPTFSRRYDNQVDFSGGAAVVSKHMRRAGAEVSFSPVMGDDALRDFVLRDLAEQEIECNPFIDRTRPTTQKNVFITGGYRMLKVDKVDNRPISERVIEHLKASLAAAPTDAVVFSDFRHGIFGRRVIVDLASSIP